MAELERARAHLRLCQESLRQWRTAGFTEEYLRENIGPEEDNFIAALSWVWEEQEKAREPTAAEVYQDILNTWERIAVEHGL